MSMDDWVDLDGYWDYETDWDEYEYDVGPTIKTCNKCGTKNLQWVRYDGHWRLADQNLKLHDCVDTVEFGIIEP